MGRYSTPPFGLLLNPDCTARAPLSQELEKLNTDIQRIKERSLNEVQFPLLKVECYEIKAALQQVPRLLQRCSWGRALTPECAAVHFSLQRTAKGFSVKG